MSEVEKVGRSKLLECYDIRFCKVVFFFFFSLVAIFSCIYVKIQQGTEFGEERREIKLQECSVGFFPLLSLV